MSSLVSIVIVFSVTAALSHGRHDPGRELIVAFRPGVSEAKMHEILVSQRAARVAEIERIRAQVIEVPAHAAERVAEALRHRDEIEFVEPDLAVPSLATPDDPYFGQAWHLAKIEAPAAWNLTTGAPDVVIAVLDSGIDASHPDLAAKLLPGWNTYSGDENTTDVYGHGTKVAGAAAATSNNGVGVASPFWGGLLLPVRVTDTNGYGYYSTIAEGITIAADQGARVINVSFASVAGSTTIASAARYAKSKGAIVVAAAGNCGCDDATPENPDLLSVGSTSSSDALSSFSSRGEYVDLSAPGAGIWTTRLGGSYGSSSGTSFSSPVTAGVIALMMSANPDLSPDEIQSILETTAVDLGDPGYDTSFGFGRLDAAAAVAAVTDATAPPPDTTAPSASITAPSDGETVAGTVTVEVIAFDDVQISSVDLVLDGAPLANDGTAPYSFAWDTMQDLDGEHALEAVARDTSGNQSASSPVFLTVRNAPDPTPTPTTVPTQEPTPEPTPPPPTPTPTPTPTPELTKTPTARPTAEPTPPPATPTVTPTAEPTAPAPTPTPEPTMEPPSPDDDSGSRPREKPGKGYGRWKKG